MARKFVRNITGTKLRGEVKEPLKTNVQNDILSDDEDVFIRNKEEYHCLTDNIKTIKTGNDSLTVVNHEPKNESTITIEKSTKIDSENGTNNSKIMTPLQTKYAIEKQVPILVKEHETPTEITSLSNGLIVDKKSKNNYELTLNIEGGGGDGLPRTKILSINDKLIVNEKGVNDFELDLNLPSNGGGGGEFLQSRIGLTYSIINLNSDKSTIRIHSDKSELLEKFKEKIDNKEGNNGYLYIPGLNADGTKFTQYAAQINQTAITTLLLSSSLEIYFKFSELIFTTTPTNDVIDNVKKICEGKNLFIHYLTFEFWLENKYYLEGLVNYIS